MKGINCCIRGHGSLREDEHGLYCMLCDFRINTVKEEPKKRKKKIKYKEDIVEDLVDSFNKNSY